MGIFTDWLKKEQGIEEPVGLDAVRQRVLGYKEEETKLVEISFVREDFINPEETPFDPDSFDAESAISSLTQFITARGANATAAVQQKAAKLVEHLTREDVNPDLIDFLQKRNSHRQELKKLEKDRELPDPNDPDSLINYMINNLGYRWQQGAGGGLILPQDDDALRRIYSGDLSTGQKGGKYLSEDMFTALFDPEVRSALLSDDPVALQKLTTKLNIPWEVAKEIFGQLKDKGAFKSWAKAEGIHQLDPDDEHPIEFSFDSEDNFTGKTSLDLLKDEIDSKKAAGEDSSQLEEEYYSQYQQSPRGDGRGIFGLQKLLSGLGGDTLGNFFGAYNPSRATIDHMLPRSQINPEEARDVERPEHWAITGKGTNFFKKSLKNSRGETDQLSGLAQYAQDFLDNKIAGVAGKKADETVSIPKTLMSKLTGEGSSPEERSLFWLVNRVNRADFARPKDVIDELPSLDDFSVLPQTPSEGDTRFIKKILDKNEKRNPLGTGLANLTTYYPRSDHRNTNMTSWSGNPADANNFGEYELLFPYKSALAAGMLYDPEKNEEMSRLIQQIEQEVMAGRGTDEQKAKRLTKKIEEAKKGFLARRFRNPLQARAAAWTTGHINNEEYATELQGLLERPSNMLSAINPSAAKKITSRANESIERYKDEMDRHWPEGKVPLVSESNPNWYSGMMDKNPMKLLGSSIYGRSKLPPQTVSQFDQAIKNNRVSARGMPPKFSPEKPDTFAENTFTGGLVL